VLTRNIELDLGSSAFTDAAARPIIVTTETADPARLRAAKTVADVVVAGERAVDLRRATASLAPMRLT
jgi:riboflavin biosynthesis pyrimidine reductase